MKIGKIIKYYRTLHRMTQYDVAEQSGINENSKHKSVYPNVLSKFIYNCNCCGYEFNEGIFCDGDMLCPECGCRYDEENGYIVKDGE